MSYEKNIAEQAFSDLLLGPVPQTGIDFRRAIVMAALIGRQLEADFAGSPWQNTPPTEPGSWEVACGETDFEPHRVRVFKQGRELWVECSDVGTDPVDTYHHNLMQTRWRKALPPSKPDLEKQHQPIMSTSTSPLFSHPEIWCLPERGRFTAAEALAEWIDFLPDLMARWDGWKGTPEAEQIDRCARHAFEQSEADAAKLLPHLDAVEDSEQLHELQSLRDRVREYIASPAPFAPPVGANEAEQIGFYAADLRASWRTHIELADKMIKDAGALPIPPVKKQFVLDGWKHMARTIIGAADLPGLDLATIEVLEELIHASDRLRALWDDGSSPEGVG